MIKEDKSKVLEESSNFKEIPMRIGDTSIISEALRNQYKNPLKVAIQEYLCNARDSHRAVSQKKKIKIYPPTEISNKLIIRDFGVGMTESDFENIFMVIGNSTKRSSDLYTGGFGLGSKVGLAYAGSFEVKLINKEKILIYNISIEETAAGSAKLVYEKDNDGEEIGTEISIAINKKDQILIIKYIVQTIFYWDEAEKPEIHGMDESFYKDFLYEIDKSKLYFHKHQYIPNETTIVGCVDGIVYPLSKEYFSSSTISDLFTHYSGGVYIEGSYFCIEKTILNENSFILFFNTGEVEISNNRETITLTEKNIQTISTKLKSSFDLFIRDLNSQLLLSESLIDLSSMILRQSKNEINITDICLLDYFQKIVTKLNYRKNIKCYYKKDSYRNIHVLDHYISFYEYCEIISGASDTHQYFYTNRIMSKDSVKRYLKKYNSYAYDDKDIKIIEFSSDEIEAHVKNLYKSNIIKKKEKDTTEYIYIKTIFICEEYGKDSVRLHDRTSTNKKDLIKIDPKNINEISTKYFKTNSIFILKKDLLRLNENNMELLNVYLSHRNKQLKTAVDEADEQQLIQTLPKELFLDIDSLSPLSEKVSSDELDSYICEEVNKQIKEMNKELEGNNFSDVKRIRSAFEEKNIKLSSLSYRNLSSLKLKIITMFHKERTNLIIKSIVEKIGKLSRNEIILCSLGQYSYNKIKKLLQDGEPADD